MDVQLFQSGIGWEVLQSSWWPVLIDEARREVCVNAGGPASMGECYWGVRNIYTALVSYTFGLPCKNFNKILHPGS